MVKPETLVLRGEEAAQAYEAERKQIPQDILVPRDSLVREVCFHAPVRIFLVSLAHALALSYAYFIFTISSYAKDYHSNC